MVQAGAVQNKNQDKRYTYSKKILGRFGTGFIRENWITVIHIFLSLLVIATKIKLEAVETLKQPHRFLAVTTNFGVA